MLLFHWLRRPKGIQKPFQNLTNRIMSEIPTTTITMVGPRGVGKTSLLAAMYSELEAELRKCGCLLTQEAGPTQAAINNQLRELKKMATGTGIKVQSGEGIDSTSQEREYIFNLDVGDGGLPEAALRFVDLPGGWYTGEGEYKKADQLLGESHVSFLAVDATALMEVPSKDLGGIGKYHDEINYPQDIIESYKRVSFKDGHIVIITLIRAETYIKSGKIDLLLQKTQDAYRDLASRLYEKDIGVFACYVETVGSLVFNSFTERDGVIESHFRRIPGKKYEPSRCGIPLRIAAGKALQSALDEALLEVVKNDGFWAWILAKFGVETALKKAKEKHSRIYNAFNQLASNIAEDDFIKINS